MELYLIALGVLAVTAVLMALTAILPADMIGTKFSRTVLGPAGIVLGCVLGLCGVFAAPWGSDYLINLPWALPFGSGAIGLDALSRFFLLPTFILGVVCTITGAMDLRKTQPKDHNMGAHWFFFCTLILALALVCTVRDCVFMMIVWEVMSVSPFFLIEFNDNDTHICEASWIYLIAAHVGAMCLLICFAMLWREAGTTVFAYFALTPMGFAANTIFILGILGFGAKAGLVPMHVWIPETYPAAPGHVAAFMAGAMINAGVYGIIRLSYFFTPLTIAPIWWGWGLIILGIASGVLGVLKAMEQGNLKRIIAYSSVENMGILLVGIGIIYVGMSTQNSWVILLGFCGTLMHMLNHSTFKSLLFLCASVIQQCTGTVRMNHLGGLQKKIPLLGLSFGVGTASISCLPPFNGFFGEFLLVLALGHSLHGDITETTLGMLFTLGGIALIGGLALATFTKEYYTIFLGEPRHECAANATIPSPLSLTPLLVPVLLCACVGVLSYNFIPYLAQAMPEVLPETEQITAVTQSIMIKAALFGLALVGLALVFIFWRRWLLRGKYAPTRTITWSCGFQRLSARVQYTGMSFSEPTSRIFGSIMGIKLRAHLDRSLFPRKASLSISRPDRVLLNLITPIFDGIIHVCDALKIIQHGRIHLYILYMLVTVIVLLVWGLSV